MNSLTTRSFRRRFTRLPPEVQRQAREAYERFRDDPTYPSLRLKQIHPTQSIFSVRISLHYRALGILDGENMIWFWIGSHADYDKMLRQR